MMSINGADTLTVDKVTLNNKNGDSQGHNTDAFDVGSSSHVTISNANIVNQDDCLAINSGTDITFTGGSCTGGHGLSIGSVGGRDDNTVDTVKILSSKIINSQNGVRIKTVSGATGAVKGVTYKDITLSGITKYGIVIQQDYENGSPTGKPTTGVPITGLTISGVTGSVTSSATPVYILCGKGSCSGWTWSGNNVTGGKKSTKCLNIPSGGAAC
jgi:polygalacturonase